MAEPVDVPTTSRMLKNVLALLFMALGGGWFTVEAGGLFSAVALKFMRVQEEPASFSEILGLLNSAGPVIAMAAAAIGLGVMLWHAGRWRGTLGATFLAIAALSLIFVIPQLIGVSPEYKTIAGSFAYGYFGLAALTSWLGLELFRQQHLEDERSLREPIRLLGTGPMRRVDRQP